MTIVLTRVKINVFFVVIGMAMSLFGTWGLYVSTHKFYLCITDPRGSNLTNCGTISNEDFPFVILQIIGIFIPIFAMILTTNFKKNDESQITCNDTSEDCLIKNHSRQIDMKKKKIDIIFGFGLFLIFILGFIFVLYPILTPLDVETVTKVSGIYKNPIFFTFHWITDDEIQVGKLVTLDVRLNGLPYNSSMNLKNIEIQIPEQYLNYWEDKKSDRQNKFPQSNVLILKSDSNTNVFRSEPINLRFIVPDDIPVIFCDYNKNSPCDKIPYFIHPAAYDLANRIDTNRILISLSLLTASLSVIVVWTRLREQMG
jgi:hypothetical protein